MTDQEKKYYEDLAEDFWIKILRSLLVLLAVLLLARPYWVEKPLPLELWVVDDSASLTTQPSLQSNLPAGIQPLRLLAGETEA